ncbi:MAG TPA: DnaJ domain-containing protein [Tianweitania sediminis]|jgi:hypothetical protein|nr:DnaJ domain-containing protein [Tianweitania sediminis]
MSIFLGIVAALAFCLLAAVVFTRADAAWLANVLSRMGPFVLGALGLGLLLVGRASFGGMLLAGAGSWFVAQQKRRRATPTPGRRSAVRTAALEMELDHDSGALEGHVLAGSFESRRLGDLDLQELLVLHEELASDTESLRLLETYLDGRFPVWRQDAEAQLNTRMRSAPASGSMSKEEAYQILGLETTASTADIRQAHRRLMQRLHPDFGGSTFLAARINEAKDVLLSHHN